MKKLVVITGCSGRIGTHVIQRFKKSDYQLIGLGPVAPALCYPDNFTYIQMDMTSQKSIFQALENIRQNFGTSIASFIHLAAYYNFSGETSALYQKVSIEGTQHFLKALQSFKTEQFLFSSTMLVYDSQDPPLKINEDSPFSNSWEYPKSKIETEKIIHREHGAIPYVILNIAACYNEECRSIPLAHQIQRLYENHFSSHVFPGNLSHGATYLHLVDLAEAVCLIVNKRKEFHPELTMLIGEDEVLSYRDLQNQISVLLSGQTWTTYSVPKWLAKCAVWIHNHLPGREASFIKPWMIDVADNHYQLDITHLKKNLGWQPPHRLSQTLPLMIENLKADPLKWYQVNHLKLPAWLEKEAQRPSLLK